MSTNLVLAWPDTSDIGMVFVFLLGFMMFRLARGRLAASSHLSVPELGVRLLLFCVVVLFHAHGHYHIALRKVERSDTEPPETKWHSYEDTMICVWPRAKSGQRCGQTRSQPVEGTPAPYRRAALTTGSPPQTVV